MPTVPEITAQSRGSSYINPPHATGEEFGTQVGTALTGAGQSLKALADKIQNEKDDLDLIDRHTALQLQKPALMKQVLAEEFDSPAERAKQFSDRVNEQLDGLLEGTTPAVRSALKAAQMKALPADLISMETEHLKALKIGNETTRLRVQHAAAMAIATSQDPAARTQVMQEYRALLDRHVENGSMTTAEREKDWQAFEQTTLKENMRYLADTNRPRLRELDRMGAFNKLDPNERVAQLAHANEMDDKEETAQDKAFKKVQDQFETYWSAMANQGAIPRADLEMALAGKHPFITPDKARTYAKINDSPPLGGASTEVMALSQEYHLGPASLSRVAEYRRRLNVLASELGRQSEDVDKFANELQTDERSARSVNAAEVAAGIRAAEDKVSAESDPVLPGRLGQMQKNMDAIERAEMRGMIRGGMKPEDAAEVLIKRRKAKREAIPKDTQGLLELVP